MSDLYSFGTPFGGVKVAREASEDFQGLIEELAQAGAPIKNIGSYNYRNIAGTNVLSEHGKGKAIDLGNQQARNVVDPAFRDWVEENPERYRQILAKHNMRGGETFKNPDLGHVEWKGEGYGNPLREAAPIGGAVPENYDTEDRTAAGIGLVPRDEAVASGPARMANGDSTGILPMLGMQNQQPQGLLGALGDPETMAYIGMMLKGMNPYSQIDPNAMLSSAHTNALKKEALRQQLAEQSIDNRRADEALNLRRQEYGEARTERQAREADRVRLKQEAADLAASQRKRDAEAFSDLTGRSAPDAAATPDAAAPDVAAPATALSNDDKIAKIDQRLAQGGLSDAGEKQLLRLREQYSKGPSATQLNILKKDEDAIPVYDDIGRKLDRALELAPKVSTGLKASAETTFGPMLGGLAPQSTQDTINFRNITSQFAIENMSQTMKGATSDKEMFKNLSIAADERNSIEIRTEALKRAKDRNDQLKEIAATRKSQIEEGTYGRKQKPRESGGGGGASDPLNIR